MRYQTLRNVALLFTLLLVCAAAPAIDANAQNRYSLKITNDSKWEIHQIHVSSTETRSWRSDLLGEYILKPSYEYTIPDLRPGEYDVKFVDEDGDECILEGVQVFRNISWSLTTGWLAKCEGYR